MPMCSAHALSSAVGVHPSTLTQTLKRLERKKRVYVTEDPKDSRRKLITITREGKRALDHAQPEMQSWESRLGRLKSELQAVQSALSGG
jgi:DNA-binding MarR family transcriptional regulator